MKNYALACVSFSFIVCVASEAQSQSAEICRLYEHSNYQGTEYRVLRNHSIRSMGDDFNDKASSAIVPAGRRLIIYQHRQFGGDTRTLNPGDYSSLGNLWNDITSAAKCRCS